MAINIDELYKFVQFVANKEQSGFIKPSEFNLSVDRAQMQLFMERYGNPAEYQPGRPVPRIAYNQTQKISDDLREFIVRGTFNVPANGIMSYPSNYLHFSSASSSYLDSSMSIKDVSEDCPDCNKAQKKKNMTASIINKMVSIRHIDDFELANILGSSIVPPTKEYPILTFYSEGVQYHPKDIGSVDFVYLRRPLKPLWSFTTPVSKPVYDSANSIDLEWPEQVFNEIAVRILSFVGINLREADLAQYSDGKRQTGI